MMIGEIEILNVLKNIENGDLTIRPLGNPSEIYSGNVIYKISNGWEMTIFNDCNTWDYIDFIKIEEGRSIDFDEMDEMVTLRNYEPIEEVSINIYKIGNV